MRKLLFLCVTVLALSFTAAARDYPTVEIFGGYSYVHVSVSGVSNATANANGGSGSIDFNLNRWFGLVGDFGGYHFNKRGASATVISYLFGPKIAFRGNEKITPFVQVLFGGAHINANLGGVGGAAAAVGSPSGSENAFALTVGGGLDWNAGRHFGIRLAQAEYFLTKFKDGTNNRQNNVRVSTGITFRW